MEVSCVRVPREEGEATRRRLADADLVDEDYEIAVADGSLYVPITDPSAVPEEFEVVVRDADSRETQTMPADLLSFDPSYERLGDVVIVDEDDPERAQALADAIVESALPVKTVVNRASKVKGTERVRDWEVLAGDSTEAVHREYGCEFALDLATVYFSPRLATERHRVAEQVEDGERAFDMFAGVGPFVIPFAKRGASAVGVDINEDAIEYLRENARRNGVEERVTGICGDVREAAAEYEAWADRLVMNLPHTAAEFADAAVAFASDSCVVHLYDIQHEDGAFDRARESLETAAGERYDVVVKARNPGRWFVQADALDGNEPPARAVVEYESTDGSITPQPPSSSSNRLQYGDLRARSSLEGVSGDPDRTFDLTLSRGRNQSYTWTIDGQAYPDADPLQIRPGEHVRIRMTNQSPVVHPMHLHGHFFQVGNAIKDTVIVPGHRGQVTLDFHADNPGRWLFHCHNLYHLDAGMARVVEYVE